MGPQDQCLFWSLEQHRGQQGLVMIQCEVRVREEGVVLGVVRCFIGVTAFLHSPASSSVLEGTQAQDSTHPVSITDDSMCPHPCVTVQHLAQAGPRAPLLGLGFENPMPFSRDPAILAPHLFFARAYVPHT